MSCEGDDPEFVIIQRAGNSSSNINKRSHLLTEKKIESIDTETQMEFSRLRKSIGINPEGLALQ